MRDGATVRHASITVAQGYAIIADYCVTSDVANLMLMMLTHAKATEAAAATVNAVWSS